MTMKDPQKTDNIISKIVKLLALSKSDNQHEAQSALSRAQELMCKYNVSVAELDDKDASEVNSIRIDETTKGCSPYRYKLASALSEHFRCKLVMSFTRKGDRSRNSRMVVYGQAKDAEIFVTVFEWAHKAFLSLWKQYNKQHPTQSARETNREKKTFYHGYIIGLVAFLEKQATEKALMVITPLTVIEHVKSEVNGHYRTTSGPSCGSHETYMAGQLAGSQAMKLKNTIEAK